MRIKAISKILMVTAWIFSAPSMVCAQNSTLRNSSEAQAEVRNKKEFEMTALKVVGAQGTLVAFRASSGMPKGLPLVLIHADPGRATQWKSVMTLMAKSRGRSGLPRPQRRPYVQTQ